MLKNKIGFIIPFRPKSESSNWDLDLFLLKRTVETIIRYPSADYHIYVIYTDRPEIDCDEELITLSEFPYVSFPISALTDYESLLRMHYDDADHLRRHLDKSRKIMWGCKLAKEAGCNFIMNVDSDDLISNKLIPFILQSNNKADGWYIPGGFVHEYKNNYFQKINSTMHLLNGSTHIVNESFIKIPELETKLWSDINFFTDHGCLKDRIENEHGGELAPIPFKAIVYSRTGINNISEPHLMKLSFFKKWLKTLLFFQPFTAAIVEEFNLNAYRKEIVSATLSNK